MTRLACLLGFLVFSLQGFAQDPESRPLGELKAAGAKRLGKAETEKLLANAEFVVTTASGSTQQWQMKPDFTVGVVSNNYGRAAARPSNASGSWEVAADGRWCTELRWRATSEKLCRRIYHLGDKHYRVSNEKDDTLAYELKLK